MLTPERAQEIIQAAHDACTCGPWSDWLDRVMQPGEREEVNQVWETMPGYTCFVDAIYRIARTHIHNWNIERGLDLSLTTTTIDGSDGTQSSAHAKRMPRH